MFHIFALYPGLLGLMVKSFNESVVSAKGVLEVPLEGLVIKFVRFISIFYQFLKNKDLHIKFGNSQAKAEFVDSTEITDGFEALEIFEILLHEISKADSLKDKLQCIRNGFISCIKTEMTQYRAEHETKQPRCFDFCADVYSEGPKDAAQPQIKGTPSKVKEGGA